MNAVMESILTVCLVLIVTELLQNSAQRIK